MAIVSAILFRFQKVETPEPVVTAVAWHSNTDCQKAVDFESSAILCHLIIGDIAIEALRNSSFQSLNVLTRNGAQPRLMGHTV